ncbi:uncharacterized protein LOC114319660 isoform X2 [Camellia sinensis]|uniref:uncharacterized protein LOC114319660 isoform X2 n=1 Tax=Camellia sinensis TaxID=4442 RepID=UPI001035F556|nr:uncharacterized protein LOC114319660 isoform X2 [Camellia sinensis]XP_028122502.1 uncharacterized protein LOC114319660 isoform X2 [Camellia sinensis]XP_028122504.1 uncharacterized protein LOC114319660 isoform X2 [Camellia sinensis]XP_028122505.1 uncharacterized protein LOC114319660 isoform X2 [Camellia sinensis]
MGCSLLVSMASLICLIILPIIFVQGKPSKAVVDSLALFGVLYDNGDVEVLCLDKECWELIDNGHEPRKYLIKNGIYDFWNWFDDQTWYPLGCVIGGTVYPGLTLTAGTMWWILNSLNIPVSLDGNRLCIYGSNILG